MKPVKIYLKYWAQEEFRKINFSVEKLIQENAFIDGFLNIFSEQSGKYTIYKIDLEAKSSMLMDSIVMDFQNEGEYERIFLNGYQSWTDSKEFKIDHRFKKLSFAAKPLLRFMGDERFYPYEKNSDLHGYTYFYLKRKNGNIQLAGSLDERFAYTRFLWKDNHLSIEKDVQNLQFRGKNRIFEIFVSEGRERDIFSIYFEKFGIHEKSIKITSISEDHKNENQNPVTGWTSWYNYYTGITEKNILENIKEFNERKIPIDYFQIDDGYQKSVGDWLTFNDKFPNGFDKIVPAIHRAGYFAGLWLAPFITEKKSFIFRDHPDWILKNKNGKFLKVGFNPLWGGWTNGYFYGLDIYNKEFQEYLQEVFYQVIENWHFDMVKLDFLYAAGMNHRGEKSRSEIMHDGMDLLRALVGGKKILGCGVPLAPAFKKVDACRIGSDIGLEWEDRLLKKIHYRERISTINSLRSTLGRWHQNYSAWLNDPDVFNLRGGDNQLNENEKYTLFIINLTLGGFVFTSDKLSRLNDKEYKLYLSIFPNLKKDIHMVDQLDEDIYRIQFAIKNNNYILLSNLTSKVFIWRHNYPILFNSQKFGFLFQSSEIKVNPHESILFYVPENKDFSILGSSGYLYPGSEINSLEYEKKRSDLNKNAYHFQVKMLDKLKASGELYIQIPNDAEEVFINGKKTKVESIRHLTVTRYRY